MTQVVLNGNAYSDDGSSSRDMGGGGHRQWLLPMLGDATTEVSLWAGSASQDAEAAGVSAQAAAQSAQQACDALQQVLNTGSGWSPVLQIAVDGARYVLQVLDWTGGRGPKPAVGYLAATGVVPAMADGLNIRGAVAYSELTGKPTLGTAAELNVPAAAGEAASAAQVVRGDDPRLTANTGSLPRSARTSMTMLGESDLGTWVDITSGMFTQTFAMAATLGSGWWCYLRNSGEGDITLQAPAGSQIDGLASYVMYSGECRLLQCDGVHLRSIVITPFHLVKRTSFDFIKPPGYRAFDMDVRGATGGGGGGGSGALRSGTGYVSAGGGGGSGGAGARMMLQLPFESLLAITPFIVGAAGVGGLSATTQAGAEGVGVAGGDGGDGGETQASIVGVNAFIQGGKGGKGGKGGSTGAQSGTGGLGGAIGLGSIPPQNPNGTLPADRYGSRIDGSSAKSIEFTGAPGVIGGFSPNGNPADALGGAKGEPITGEYLAGSSGAGGDGGPGLKGLTAASVSQAGANGEPGMVIISGVL